jgi:AraC-like DNA-binding protein
MKEIKYFINSNYDSTIELKSCTSCLHSSKAHLHNEISIGLIESGSCNLEVYNKNYFLKEKSILLIPDNIIHKCTPINLENWSFKMIYIKKDWIEKNMEFYISDNDFKHKELDANHYRILKALFLRLDKSENLVDEEYNLYELLSYLLHNNFEYTEFKNDNNYTVGIKKIKNYIDNFYLNNISLDELSNISNLSKYYLIRRFEEVYGISPHKYINAMRVVYAKSIFSINNNIADIALESGFYDQSHFTKIFKEFSGVTPMKYLKAIKK